MTLSEEIKARAKALLDEGKAIDAIKIVKEHCSSTLKEAKTTVENLIEEIYKK